MRTTSGSTHSVTDSIGREVQVPDNPERIAALDSFSGELLVMIGAGDTICGVPAGVSSDDLLCQIYPDLSGVTVPISGGTINLETLMYTYPDVILIKSSLYNSYGERAKLDKLGVPYLVVNYSTMDEQMDAIRMIGEVCGGQTQERAAALDDYYQSTIEMVQAHVANIPDSEKLKVYHSINGALLTDGRMSLGTDWIECAGGIDVSSGEELLEGETDYTASLEQVYAWDPDVIICNSATTTEYLLTDSKWTGLRTVYEGAVYTIPVGATRWGQRGSVETYLAMLWMDTTLYPEYFSDIDLKSTVITYYRDYLGLDIDDTTYEMMLSGEGLRNGSSQSGGSDGSSSK